ncbi:MAG TPA: hypothetical protein VEN81_15690, partial [Planctomycetota bacterium]|nr:hypothetical protein [Planctomycetota bacterium]
MTKNAESRFYTPSTRRLERPAAAGDSRGFRYVLSEAGSRSLEDRLERLSSPYLNPEETLGEIFPAFASTFPRDLWTRLLQFRADPDAPGFGILGNLPVDRHLPPTPH